MVDTDVVVTDEIGFALRMIDMTILGSYYAIIPYVGSSNSERSELHALLFPRMKLALFLSN